MDCSQLLKAETWYTKLDIKFVVLVVQILSRNYGGCGNIWAIGLLLPILSKQFRLITITIVFVCSLPGLGYFSLCEV